MEKYKLSLQFLYMKKGDKVTITSVDPLDIEYIELTDVASDMFVFVVEENGNSDKVSEYIQKKYTDVSEDQIKNDFKDLMKFLSDKKILVAYSQAHSNSV